MHSRVSPLMHYIDKEKKLNYFFNTFALFSPFVLFYQKKYNWVMERRENYLCTVSALLIKHFCLNFTIGNLFLFDHEFIEIIVKIF